MNEKNNFNTIPYNEAYEKCLEYFNGDALAAKVFLDKYAMRDGDKLYEATPKDAHKRIAKEFARIENKFGGDNVLTEEDIFKLFDHFKYVVPGGSVLSGVGNETYVGSLSNCFVLGQPEDSYSSIMKYRGNMVSLEKRRGGVGLDLSKLRPSGTKVNNAAGSSTGPVSFMEGFSSISREVAQSGRRGALMISISGNHPDVYNPEKDADGKDGIDFISVKQDLTKVTGANISIKFSDEFMRAVISDDDYVLRWPVDINPNDYKEFLEEHNEYNKKYWTEHNDACFMKVRAKDVWNKFIHCAWNTAEPGIMYEDRHHDYSPDGVYPQYRGVSTNPCFTGDTIVAVADGRNGVSIKELAESGKPFPVYSAHKKVLCRTSIIKNWKVEIKNAVAFKTGTKDVIEVTLSDGSKFKCTPEHRLATAEGEYIEAKDSIGVELSRFFSYCPMNNVHKYRYINSFTCNRQYNMIADYFGINRNNNENIHHVDGDSTNDCVNNLCALDKSFHVSYHMAENNSINKIEKGLLSLLQSRKSVYGNAKKYNWSIERLNTELCNWDIKHSKELESYSRETDEVVNNYIDPVFVVGIQYVGIEDVYDLSVEDNHNFYIITKTNDGGYLNSSGILVHNCGEIFMEPGDSCRLMHINMASFVLDNGEFDYDLLHTVAYDNMKLCDDLVELELEKVEKIIEHIKSGYIEDNRDELELWEKIYETGKKSRRAGCGATGVADALALMGIKLNSDMSYECIKEMFRIKMNAEIEAQVDMAKVRGTFDGYDFSMEFGKTKTQTRMYRNSNLNQYYGKNPFFENMLMSLNYAEDPELIYKLEKYGRRNVSWSTMAPVGTGAIMTQGTSGIEPLFLPYNIRRKKCSSKDDRVDFIDKTGEKFTEYFVFHKPFKDWIIRTEPSGYDITKTFDEQVSKDNAELIQKWFEMSPWFGCTAQELTPDEHVKLQSIVQLYTSHSISKTCNLPSEATEKEVNDIYIKAWQDGCKGVTVYRDGCRAGVMIKNTEGGSCKCTKTLVHSAPRRPKSLPCDIKRFRNGGDRWIACVGLYQGEPYEIFTGLAEKLDLPESVDKCSIIKNRTDKEVLNEETGAKEIKTVSSYDLVYTDKNGDIQMIENIGGAFRSEFYTVSKMTSALLRHGMPIEYVISTIKSLDFKNDTINSWKSGVMRALKTYIKDGEVPGETCPECGGKIIRENGCKHCAQCGWSACG